MWDLVVAGAIGGMIVLAVQLVIVPGVMTIRESLRRRRLERGQ